MTVYSRHLDIANSFNHYLNIPDLVALLYTSSKDRRMVIRSLFESQKTGSTIDCWETFAKRLHIHEGKGDQSWSAHVLGTIFAMASSSEELRTPLVHTILASGRANIKKLNVDQRAMILRVADILLKWIDLHDDLRGYIDFAEENGQQLLSTRPIKYPSLAKMRQVIPLLKTCYGSSGDEADRIHAETKAFRYGFGGIRSLPSTLQYYTALTTLNIRCAWIGVLPDYIFSFTRLQELNIGPIHSNEIPDRIGALSRLTLLTVHKNYISTLPKPLSDLPLRFLNLSSNQLTDLPSHFTQMTALKVLNLSGNQFTVLPPLLIALTCIQHLWIAGNQLSDLPSLTTLRLIDLNASCNHLTTFPRDLIKIDTLRKLDLCANCLTDLPDSIDELRGLTKLNLVANKIRELPWRMGLLANFEDFI